MTLALHLPRTDLDHVLRVAPARWDDLRKSHVLMTGATGFVGSWLLATLLWAGQHLDLGLRVTVLTRDPHTFSRRMPGLAGHPSVTVHAGDVQTFAVEGRFDVVVHAAAQALAGNSATAHQARYEADIAATARVLEVVRRSGASRLLFTSSGAVYGTQPPDLVRVPENHPGIPDAADPATAYGRSKRESERLITEFGEGGDSHCTIARCFAFVGPLLPLAAGYAAGDFLGDALRGGPVQITGDGTAVRSYLHAADLAAWLWTILLNGESCRPYNVGSDDPTSIARLAARVAALPESPCAVSVAGPPPARRTLPPRYVPCICRAQDELGLRVWIDLDDALRRTWAWLRQTQGNHGD
jgi:dTDP-glucose 4,6-dehydratase